VKKTLERFFQRTAHSRDASEFLMQYSSIESECFLLMIPVLGTAAELVDFVAELEYMAELELWPALLLVDQHFAEGLQRQLVVALNKMVDPLRCIECESKDFLEVLIRVAEDVEYFKYLWTGGSLANEQAQVVSRVHLNNCREKWSVDSMETLVWVRPFLLRMGQATSIQMVKPHQILPELFTRNGAGTLISLGYQFALRPMAEVDTTRLKSLLEDGFGKPILGEYFEKLNVGSLVLVEADYRGAIVLEPWGNGIHYLDKIVVESSFFGRGLGSLLLDELTLQLESLPGDFPKLCWRAKLDNPYLTRYASLVHGAAQQNPMMCGTLCDGDYVYHFAGVPEVDRGEVLSRMKGRRSSFEEDSFGHPL
jgi:ribosomal protein S18 acetylase RimI-like enzyme